MTVRARHYPANHWTQKEPSEELLIRYLQGNEQPYNHAKAEIFLRLLGKLDDVPVLDFGGGGGYLAVQCAVRGARVTIVDGQATTLRLAAMLAQRRGVEERVRTLPGEGLPAQLAHKRFPVVLLKNVIEHVADDAGLLRAIAGCQQRGDRLVLSTQNRRSLNYLLEGTYQRWWCKNKDWCGWDPTHLRFYTPRSLRRLLRGAGYRVRRTWGIYAIPYDLPTWLVLRRWQPRWEWLHKLDLKFGKWFPLNRWGWNAIVLAERRG